MQQSQTKVESESRTAPNSKIEQKPVECNLCHRKFKNIPALNGHMRLHGGYFKKDADTKKCDKKEAPGPPLQTASVGIRALIEEKIISKRGKDLKVNILYILQKKIYFTTKKSILLVFYARVLFAA